MKRLFAFAVAALLLCLTALPAFAVADFSTVDKPYGVQYAVYNDGNDEYIGCERIIVACLFTDEFAAFTGMDDVARNERYGMTSIYSYLQVDYRIDGGSWQANDVWETTPDAPDYKVLLQPGETVTRLDMFYLNNEATQKQAGVLTTKNEEGQFALDLDNHSLEIRMRVSMAYTKDGMNRVIVSEWTDACKVERNHDFGELPEKLDAPVLSNPRVLNNATDEMPYLAFNVAIPESVKEAEAWLSTQVPVTIGITCYIDKGTGSWEEVNISGNGSFYSNETKKIYLTEVDCDDAKTVKIKMIYYVYLDGQQLVSEESDVLTFSTPRWTAEKGIMHAKCKVCGICRPTFGICMFIWLVMIVVVAIVAAVVIKMQRDKKAAQKAAEEEERRKKEEEERLARKAEKEKNRKHHH